MKQGYSMEINSAVHQSHLIQPSTHAIPSHHQSIGSNIDIGHARSKAITWEGHTNDTSTIQSNVNIQTTNRSSLSDSIGDVFSKTLRSIINIFSSSSPATETTPSRLKDSVLPSNRQPLASGTPVLVGVANAYSEGINSPQYQLILKTINSSPLLLEMMNKYQVPIKQVKYDMVEAGFMTTDFLDNPYIAINKTATDSWYKESLMDPNSFKDNMYPLRVIGHEYGHVDYYYGTSTAREIRETFERRQQAWINSLPDPSIGLTGFDAQTFVDDMLTSYLATEGYADIQAWNVLHSARAKPPLAQYNFVTNKANGFTFNSDGTIPLTVDNVYKYAQRFRNDSFYKNQYLSNAMPFLVKHAKPGDVIRLSGYDPNTIQRFGFQATSAADTFIKT